MRVLNEVILTAGDASGNLTSDHGLLAHVIGYSIQIVVTGSATGTVKLQGSSDPVPDSQFNVKSFPVQNWTDIANSDQNITGAGSVMYNVDDSFYNWVRVVYTSTSGTGTMTIRFNSKGF